jgi:trans-2,3-dihydro-3-hydroxyanthranilate isomerase
VLDADRLSGVTMLAITREMRQFETVFLTAMDLQGRQAAARIFTAEEELDFAGHPILGAAAVLHDLSGPAAPGTWQIALGPRKITVRTTGLVDGTIGAEMNQGHGTLGPILPPARVAAYLRALDLEPSHAHPQLPMRTASTGLSYLLVPVRDGLSRASIVGQGFEALLGEVGAKFVYVFDPAHLEGRTWDNAGRVEDVATGSAAGPLGLYLAHHGLLPTGHVVLHQGRFVGRPSTIDVRIDDITGDVWVGGPVVRVAYGRLSAAVTPG